MSAFELSKLQLHTLRGRLALWFVVLAMLTLLCVGLYVGKLATQQRAASAGQTLHAAATAAAQLLGANLRERELDIALLGQELHVTRGPLNHPDLLKSLQLRRESRSELVWLGLTDAEGKVIQAIDGLLVGQSVASRPWFIAGKERVFTGDVHEAVLLAKLLPAAAPGEPVRFIDFAAPIRAPDGRLLGVVGAHASWSWVTHTVQEAIQKAGSDVEVLILDRQGAVLFPEAMLQEAKRPPTASPPPAFSTVTWEDGRDYLTSEVAVDAKTPNDLGWRIVVRQPLDEALAPARALRDRLIVLGFLAALGFGLLALPLAHTVSRPIEQLAATAQQIEQRSGEPTAPVRTRLREVQQLDQSIQSMTRSLLAREQELETLNQTLEQQVTQRTQALETANQELERLATHDALTGLYNRRHCDDRLAECIAAGLRTGRPFGMFILDADHFKQINDRFGHATGDLVLQQVAEVLRSQVRQTDLAARYGGEEFVVVLPLNHDAEGVAQVAEKVRAAIEAAEFSDVGKVTVSIGTCVWEPPNNSVAGLVHRADLALYRAKALGRNRVEVAAPTA